MSTSPTDTPEGSAAPPGSGSMTAVPSFFRALRGIWLFTWRTQLTWGRLPMKLAGLLVLPVLVYITTLTAEKWAVRYSPVGDPATQVNDLSRRLERAGVPLEPGQRRQMMQIFTEEFSRTERALPPVGTAQPGDTIPQVRACYARIGDRLRTVLNDGQMSRFQNFERRNVRLSEERANEPRWSWSAPFYHWLIDFYFFVILPFACIRASGGLIRDDLQADTLGFLLTRPLSRGRLILLRYLTQTAWLQIVLLVETLLLVATGAIRHVPDLGVLVPLFLAAQFLAVFAWSALGTVLGLISSRYIALALVYGLIVEMGIGRIPTNINTLSVMRHLKTLLAHNPALEGIYEWSGDGTALSVGALVLSTVVFVGTAIILFTLREYHRATELPK